MTDPGSFDPPPGAEPPRPDSDIPLWAVVTAIAVMLAGAGVVAFVLLGGVLEKKEEKKPTYPAAWDPRITPYVKAVEKHRGLRFLHPVTVRFVAGKDFEKNVTADEKDLDKDDRKEIEQQTGLLRAVGLIGPGVDLFAAINDAYGSGTLAYYSFEKQEIVIRGTTLTLAAHATLVHELTHALQDQHFAIGKKQQADAKKTRKNDGEGGTAGSVYDAIVEGDAERIAAAYREALPRAQRAALAKAEARTSSKVETSYKKIPKVVLTLVSSPYTLGQAMVQTVAQDGGNSAVDTLFRDPPTHEDALLDPLEVIEGDIDAADVAAPKLGKGERKFASDEFGALSWYFVLAQRMPMRDALDAADGWNGDRYVAFDRDGTTCTRVDIAGESAADTTRLLQALQRWSRAVPGTPASAKKAGKLVRFESCDPGRRTSTGKDNSTEALTLVAIRGQLGAAFLKSGAPVKVAHCLASLSIREFPLSTLTADKLSNADTRKLQQLARSCAGR